MKMPPPRATQFSKFESSLLETTIAILGEEAANTSGTQKSLRTNLIDVTGPSTRGNLLRSFSIFT